jgi:TRAP-type C4-dicarboxylate transport system permease small subunit
VPTLILSGALAVFFLVSGIGAVLRVRRALATPTPTDGVPATDGDARDRAIVQLTLGVVFLLTFFWTLSTG